MNTPNQKINLIVLRALMMALCCIATMIIRIPSPMGGYVNMGDCIVLLSAWILGPLYGAVAAGTGSALADLLSGYAIYAPATLLIKGGMAAAAALLMAGLKRRKIVSGFVGRVLCVLVAQSIMVLGYLAFDGLALGYGAGALANIPGNLIQSAFSLAASLGLSQLLIQVKIMEP